jgi:2-polyprenyl-6-methoxyphenol hydroxylase-like FAD-dependent oxidoreductase
LNAAPSALPERADVVIVGAGPTGLAAACALSARGVDVVALDRAAVGTNTSRAAVVHARTLEVLDEIDVSGELVDRGVIVPTSRSRTATGPSSPCRSRDCPPATRTR